MIKLLKKYQVQVTLFTATKDWNLNNTDNQNLLLFESTGSDDGLPIALEFIDYDLNWAFDNDICDIALEQQPNDLATSQIGLNVQGIVYPNTEPLNDDGTYKRSIYHQVKTMFYNSYLDPSKIWGVENIDFTLSQTQRSLSDQFRLVDVPRSVYGDKITPNTVVVYDNTLDNVYTITDDGNGNLFAGKNLFSHQQELGEYVNKFIASESSSYCDFYWLGEPYPHLSESVAFVATFYTGSTRNWWYGDTASFTSRLSDAPTGIPSGSNVNVSSITSSRNSFISNHDFPTLVIQFLYGSTDNQPPLKDVGTFTAMFNSGGLQDVVTTITSSFDTPTIGWSFISGTVQNVVTTITASFDSMSFNAMFVSGSNITNTFPATASFDSASFGMVFISGSNITNTFPVTMSFDSMSFTVGFSGGSLM
jgi:hypothetical protein